ncbi:folylpolyglutamate synthase, mitochondrial [Strongylocentrotus purpuratus]|uniref:tetrahydrofolate synthase n=1 Tax=Strongylocentrotus purpuratus TaxID=7668 RepID=A0A7M7RCW9_STRPU|nr:folylpolyglutamate synthase, mitochondrial [Strongylocentrotus purpuratus]
MDAQTWNIFSDEQVYELWQKKAESYCQGAGPFEDKLRGRAPQDVLIFLERVGIGRDVLDGLSIIHVTGTKGKGSTCAFVENILETCGYKTGLLSSPSLIEIRERIRIGGTYLPRRKFAEYGLTILQKLEDAGNSGDEQTTYRQPNFIQYLTVLSMHIFLKEKVDVGIVEVFIGGETDCTNIFKTPSCVGITTLDLDHRDKLGDSLESIAWHKSGLARKDRPLFTVSQESGPLKVMVERASEFGAILKICPPLVELSVGGSPIELGPEGGHQAINASLAVQLARHWIEERDPNRFTFDDPATKQEATNTVDINITIDNVPLARTFNLPDEFIQALKRCDFPGRCQIVRGNHVTFYCDVAHTVKSMHSCGKWFMSKAGIEREELGGHVKRVLMYSMVPKFTMPDILSQIADVDFDAILFSPGWTTFGEHDETHPARFKNKNHRRQPQQEYRNTHVLRTTFEDILDKRYPADKKKPIIKEFPSVSTALQWVVGGDDDLPELLMSMAPKSDDHFDGGSHIQVLVTGCVPIVGGIIKIFDPSSVLEYKNGV